MSNTYFAVDEDDGERETRSVQAMRIIQKQHVQFHAIASFLPSYYSHIFRI